MNDIVHNLETETRAASLLREHLVAIVGDDEDLLRDTIEGDTNVKELLTKAVVAITEAQADIIAIKEMIGKLKERMDRRERFIGHVRTACLAAMDAAEIKTHVSPYGTLSRKAVPPSLVVTNEAEIPSQYWKPSDPTLDKKALLDALKDKQSVPGASLSNGGTTISLRV